MQRIVIVLILGFTQNVIYFLLYLLIFGVKIWHFLDRFRETHHDKSLWITVAGSQTAIVKEKKKDPGIHHRLQISWLMSPITQENDSLSLLHTAMCCWRLVYDKSVFAHYRIKQIYIVNTTNSIHRNQAVAFRRTAFTFWFYSSLTVLLWWILPPADVQFGKS